MIFESRGRPTRNGRLNPAGYTARTAVPTGSTDRDEGAKK
jgi:hypothetical protein